jgi:hypothetical protein
MTYGSEENVDVLRPRVDDNVVDVSLLDLAQHLAVSVDRSLTDVHFHFARRRRSHQILQPQQTCGNTHAIDNKAKLNELHDLILNSSKLNIQNKVVSHLTETTLHTREVLRFCGWVDGTFIFVFFCNVRYRKEPFNNFQKKKLFRKLKPHLNK